MGILIFNQNDNNKGICYPAIIRDFIIMVIFPPFWVLIKEIYSDKPLPNIVRIVINLLLTSCFYFPGLIHAINIYKIEGSI